jgi:hypothetical protein
MHSAGWEDDTLVIRVPFAEFEASLEYLDHGDRRHRILDREALKWFVAEHAFGVSAFGDRHVGNVDTITEWIDLLMLLAAKNAAGIGIDDPRRKGRR